MPEVKRTIPTVEQLVLRDGESDYRLRHLGVETTTPNIFRDNYYREGKRLDLINTAEDLAYREASKRRTQ